MMCIISSAWVNSLGTVGLFVSPFAIISMHEEVGLRSGHATTVLNVASDIDCELTGCFEGKSLRQSTTYQLSPCPNQSHPVWVEKRSPSSNPWMGGWTQVRADLLECARHYRAWREKPARRTAHARAYKERGRAWLFEGLYPYLFWWLWANGSRHT